MSGTDKSSESGFPKGRRVIRKVCVLIGLGILTAVLIRGGFLLYKQKQAGSGGWSEDTQGAIEVIRADIRELDCNQKREDYSQEVQDYFSYYGLDYNDCDVRHFFGKFEAEGYDIATHVFVPTDNKATVVAVHGYLNHAGQLRYLAGHLVQNGFAVGVFDLPGHGLSSGERGSIADFRVYSNVLAEFMDMLSADGGGCELDGPYYLAGFSLGGAVCIDYSLSGVRPSFEKVVLVAPLVRSWGWGISKFGYKVFNGRVDHVPRLYKRFSSSREASEFLWRDPLTVRNVPTEWIEALYEWNEAVGSYSDANVSTLVIQGRDDTTVDYDFNTKWIESKFNDVEIVVLDEGRHELLNEKVQIREKVLEEIVEFLEGK